jgi:hypothetical protein
MQKIVGGAFHAHEFSGARDIARKTADLCDQVIALETLPAPEQRSSNLSAGPHMAAPAPND